MKRVYYTKPSITELETRYAADAAANGWGERCYEYIEKFERGFEAHLGVRHALATSSCTGALHMGLAALGVGPGDEVILADTNWVASVAPIVHLGATPVFVDVLQDSWCIDPAAARAAVTARTKAIMAVHLYGNVCDLGALQTLATEHGISLVEDAAEAIGSKWHGRRVGSIGTFGAFSFHGTKTLTTGEGGMFVTQDPQLYERVLTLSNHGRARDETRQFWAGTVGYKYKMSNLQAAIGCAQLERVESLVAAKRRIFETYRRLLDGLPVAMNPEPADTINGLWMPTMVVQSGVPFDRPTLLESFRREQIDGRVFFWPLSSLPPFSRCDNPVSYSLSERGCNLPSYHDIAEADQERVVDVVRRVVFS